MKLSKIVKAVAHLRATASTFPVDHEMCNQLEHELWRDVLHATAMGKGSEAKAAAALETEQIKFERWRA